MVSYIDPSDGGQGYIKLLINPTCTRAEFSLSINDNIKMDFSSYINNQNFNTPKIQFKELPGGQSFKYYDTINNDYVNDVEIDTIYDITITQSDTIIALFKYTALSTSETYTFYFYGANSENIIGNSFCIGEINVFQCYKSCKTCNSGSITNHLCKECLTDSSYYPKVIGEDIECFNSETIDDGYYLDESSSPILWKECHESCAKCTGNLESNCITCANGKFWKSRTEKQCEVPPTGYYGDTTTGYIEQCYSSCETCIIGGDETNHNCESCKTDYYLAEDLDNKNCYYQLDGYYKDTAIWRKCASNCATCTGGTVNDCNLCAPGYYFKDGSSGPNNPCYNSDTIDSHYYLDTDAQLYKECYRNCATCSQGLINDNQNCLTCDSINYPILYGTNCYDECPSPTYEFNNKCIVSCPSYTVANSNNKCVSCKDKDPSTEFLYKGNCIATKPDNTFVANYNYQILDDCYQNCKTCETGGDSKKMNCTSCINDFYRLEDKPYQCYDKDEIVEGYFVDTTNEIFISCYKTCKTCSTKGNAIDHQCITCKSGYGFDPYNTHNCINACKVYWYKDLDTDEHKCIDSCPSNYPYLVINTGECVKTCSSAYNSVPVSYFTYEYQCLIKCPENSLRDDLQKKCRSLSNLNDFSSSIINYLTYINSPVNKYIYGDNVNFLLYNTTKEGIIDRNNISYQVGMSILDNMDECFDILKNIYSINDDSYFYIGLFEFNRNDTNAPQFDYMIFNSNGVELDNNYCRKVNVTISKYFGNSSKVSLAIDLYNKYKYDIVNYVEGNKFFSDICQTFSYDGYDILLDDRYKYFYHNNEYYFCESDCSDISLDTSKYRVNCTCLGRKKFEGYEKEDFDKYSSKKQIFHDKFFDYVKCSNNVFSSDLFKKNPGNYILLTFFTIQIISCVIFFIKGGKPFFSYLYKSQIVEPINNIKNMSNPPKKRIDTILRDLKREDEKKNNPKEKLGQQYANKYLFNQNQFNNDNSYRNSFNDNNINNKSPNNYFPSPDKETDNELIDITDPNKKKQNLENKIKLEEEAKKRDLELEEAEKLDKFNNEIEKYLKYTFSELYWFVLKKKHKIISLFFRKDIYEIFSFKLSFLILTLSFDIFFCTFYSFNFYLKNLYHKKKKILYGYECIIGILSAISCYIIMKLIEYFMEYRTEFRKYEINNEKENDKKNLFEQLNSMITKLQIKFIFFFILTFVLNIFIWYFVCAYCSTFSHSLAGWGLSIFFDIIISFGFPFIYYACAVSLQYNAMIKVKYGQYNCSMCLLKL